MTASVVESPLSERAERLIDLNAELVGATCPSCETRDVVAVDIARSGIEPDPNNGVRSDVPEGAVLLAHSSAPGDWCTIDPDEITV